jgi:hypothetical protein
VASGSAFATNGYFTHGVGTQSKGMAGTGVGSNADMGAIMSASNPALGVFVSDQWEAGLSIFSPRRSYVASSSDLNGGLVPLPAESSSHRIRSRRAKSTVAANISRSRTSPRTRACRMTATSPLPSTAAAA